jgi:hypothetical protein
MIHIDTRAVITFYDDAFRALRAFGTTSVLFDLMAAIFHLLGSTWVSDRPVHTLGPL